MKLEPNEIKQFHRNNTSFLEWNTFMQNSILSICITELSPQMHDLSPLQENINHVHVCYVPTRRIIAPEGRSFIQKGSNQM